MLLSRFFTHLKSSATFMSSSNLNFTAKNNQRRLMSSKFVDRLRLQQKLKATDQLSQSQYSTALYLLFVRKGGLVMISKNKGRLINADYTGLSGFQSDIERHSVFLNIDEADKCRLAVELPSLSSEEQGRLEDHFQGCFVPLRQSLFLLTADQSALVSQSRSLFVWRRRRNFCPECGSPLHLKEGHKLCGACGTPQYAQTSPVGIALVENADHSSALLVRQPRHPPGMFSCLAGFVDPGESLEQTVVREVGEEVGLEVSQVRYVCSQHWPYPAGRLMLGCLATALPGEVDIDTEELEEAAWFKPAQLQQALQRAEIHKPPPEGQIWLPPPGALAHSIIGWWLQQYHSK